MTKGYNSYTFARGLIKNSPAFLSGSIVQGVGVSVGTAGGSGDVAVGVIVGGEHSRFNLKYLLAYSLSSGLILPAWPHEFSAAQRSLSLAAAACWSPYFKSAS